MTDVILGGRKGRQMNEALRATRPNGRARFVSGCTDSVRGEQVIRDSELQLPHKTFSPTELTQAVADALSGAPATAARAALV